jgi:ABC-type multidrug transport system ATPase subunit
LLLYKGKTTLLNVLNFRNRGNLKIDGDVKINGRIIGTTAGLASISGYVQQEDLFVGTLKVKEQLKFQVILRPRVFFKKKTKILKLK